MICLTTIFIHFLLLIWFGKIDWAKARGKIWIRVHLGADAHAEAKRLLHELMKDYNRHVLPVPSINQTVNVKLGLKLSQLSDIDERNQIMTTTV